MLVTTENAEHTVLALVASRTITLPDNTLKIDIHSREPPPMDFVVEPSLDRGLGNPNDRDSSLFGADVEPLRCITNYYGVTRTVRPTPLVDSSEQTTNVEALDDSDEDYVTADEGDEVESDEV